MIFFFLVTYRQAHTKYLGEIKKGDHGLGGSEGFCGVGKGWRKKNLMIWGVGVGH